MDNLRKRMQAGEVLAGTFVKTPAYEVIEVLAQSGLDFLCLDGEHAPFDRARMDACLAVGRALGVSMLVRVPSAAPDQILQALDSGAVGVVVPHVDSAEKAEAVARAARFGHGGRGFAGSTRWAGFATKPMPEVLKLSDETVVIAQIEEPEGVDAAKAIAAVPGIDGLFAGPADLAVCYGVTSMGDPKLAAAMGKVAEAAAGAKKTFMTFAGSASAAEGLHGLGVRMFFVASEHAFMLTSARATAEAVHKLR